MEKRVIRSQFSDGQLRIAERIAAELFAPRTYWIETFGCQMNVRDSETLAGLLRACGFSPAAGKEGADLLLFNTCCIRDHAEKRVYGNLGALREWKEEDPKRILAVSGCMMQQDKAAEKLMRRFPFVDLTFGTHVVHRFPELLRAVLAGERVTAVGDEDSGVFEGLPSVRPEGVSAFVNINFGCNNFCSYCIVPYVRGRERFRTPEDILAEIRRLVDAGYTEITLLGQNVNSYGQDLAGCDFPALLTRVQEVEGLKRIRFMTSHPKDLSPALVEAMASCSKVCHHVHLPLQSGSEPILKQMNRRYTPEQYLEKVALLRDRIPDVELTTDLIVGFPGETEEDFSDTLAMVERVGYALAFTFKYSPRRGTVAAGMPDQVSESVKRERLARLNALQEQMSRKNNEKYIGHVGEVLVEGCDEKTGRTVFGKYANFKMVYFPGTVEQIGRYVTVRAKSVRGNSLLGAVEEEQ